MDSKNFYKILQVDPSAEQEVIEGAFKRLALKYHPDMNRSPESTRKMQDINEAYATLGDPAKRESYDRELNAQASPGSVWADQAYKDPEQKIREENYRKMRVDAAQKQAEYERQHWEQTRQEQEELDKKARQDQSGEAYGRPQPGKSEPVGPDSVTWVLQQADRLGRTGELERAAETLELAAKSERSWGPMLSGLAHNAKSASAKPASGYGLLVHLAAGLGREDLAVMFYSRMLDLNPRAPEHARQAAEEANIEYAVGVRLKPLRLMIVDDKREMRDDLRKLLRPFPDIDIVDTPSNGADAVDAFNSMKPDVMTTAISLPITDGITATSIICKGHSNARIVFLAVQTDLNSRKRAKEAGACDFFAKPPLLGRFLIGIRRAAGRVAIPVEKNWWTDEDR